MPDTVRYPGPKPLPYDVVVLCEGDAIGYEQQLLKAWADSSGALAGRFVGPLACGTSTAIFGMTDALGRTMPVIVVEDRDFRTCDEAQRDCDRKCKSRRVRGAEVRGWFAWRRNEIENYLIDDTVLPRVFSSSFQCSEDEVRAAVRDAVRRLPVWQAMEYVLYRARRSWDSTDPSRRLRVEVLEYHSAGCEGIEPRDARAKLEKRLRQWWEVLREGSTWPVPLDSLLEKFDAKCDEWTGLGYEDEAWRQDWACKEVLKSVRMTLAHARAGWWSLPEARGAPVEWSELPPEKRDQHDRWIERQVQDDLVKAVVGRLADGPGFDLREEMECIACAACDE